MDSLCDRYPLHKAIFDGNLRKVSGYLRTCNIEEKDVHGKNLLFCGDRVLKASNGLFSFTPHTRPAKGYVLSRLVKAIDFFCKI